MSKKNAWVMIFFLLVSSAAFCPCSHAFDSLPASSQQDAADAKASCHHDEGSSTGEESGCCGQCGAHIQADSQVRNEGSVQAAVRQVRAFFILMSEQPALSILTQKSASLFEFDSSQAFLGAPPLYILHGVFLI